MYTNHIHKAKHPILGTPSRNDRQARLKPREPDLDTAYHRSKHAFVANRYKDTIIGDRMS